MKKAENAKFSTNLKFLLYIASVFVWIAIAFPIVFYLTLEHSLLENLNKENRALFLGHTQSMDDFLLTNIQVLDDIASETDILNATLQANVDYTFLKDTLNGRKFVGNTADYIIYDIEATPILQTYNFPEPAITNHETWVRKILNAESNHHIDFLSNDSEVFVLYATPIKYRGSVEGVLVVKLKSNIHNAFKFLKDQKHQGVNIYHRGKLLFTFSKGSIFNSSENRFVFDLDEDIRLEYWTTNELAYEFSQKTMIRLYMVLILLLVVTLFIYQIIGKRYLIRPEQLLIKTNEKLSEERNRAMQAEKVKSQFLANMSHEIRTPLNGIMGMLDILKDNVPDQKGQKMIKTIQTSCDALVTVINDILDFSKIEAKKLQIEETPFHFQKMISQVVTLFNPIASDKGLFISVKIAPDVPEIIVSDDIRYRQIINNLLSNAIKFSKIGKIEIQIRAIQDEDKEDSFILETSVKDNGIGISKEDQDKLFENFSQVDYSNTRRFGGTGLGLSICRGIVELMGGVISVDSYPGAGSTFTFTLECKKASQEQIAQIKKSTEKEELTQQQITDFKNLKVLIVEDNAVNQTVTRGLLKKLGAYSEVAINGKEGVDKVLRNKYDIVLMDCHMPVMDGFAATKEIIKQLGDNRPYIIALTASAMKEDVDRCFQTGMDEFLSKPLSQDALERMLLKSLPELNKKAS